MSVLKALNRLTPEFELPPLVHLQAELDVVPQPEIQREAVVIFQSSWKDDGPVGLAAEERVVILQVAALNVSQQQRRDGTTVERAVLIA